MSIDCNPALYIDLRTDRMLRANLVRVARLGKVIRRLGISVAAASLAACAQSSVLTQKSELQAKRVASLEHSDRVAPATIKRSAWAARKHTPFVSGRHAGDTKTPSHGVASFYTEGTKTASGEKFDTMEMTAAHPTLPFGTKLRVTDAASGKSVTVRVNDRGPYVHGRVVDVSYSAANALGMVGKGVTDVKLEVIK